jgi:demethylmenaquinone methyltransferase / 2-methoxy-6-polyprenyl-1,4-benzoquinol methylase
VIRSRKVPDPPARSPAEQARDLFAPLGPTYDRVGAALSLGQDPRWRRFLVSRIPRGGHVLDVATGTGLVAAQLLRLGHQVTGLDQSPEMLAVARRRFGDEVALVNASADALPFQSDSFDHLTFTYLLRYVADPAATLAELARVVRPGGFVGSLEFGVPKGPAHPLWDLYVKTALPLAGRLLRRGWPEVGDFLGGSIRDFWQRYPRDRQLGWWHAAGLREVQVRRLSFGAAVVIWGRKT